MLGFGVEIALAYHDSQEVVAELRLDRLFKELFSNAFDAEYICYLI